MLVKSAVGKRAHMSFEVVLKMSHRNSKMMAQPVKPARKMDEMRPRLRGNRLVMCSWDRWKHIPPAPKMTAPAGSALK